MVKIRDIIQLLDTPIIGGDLEQQITSVTSDSRSVLPGAVFVCIIGKHMMDMILLMKQLIRVLY